MSVSRTCERLSPISPARWVLADVVCVPVSAQRGDNVVRRGGASWWTGPTLIEVIERSRLAASHEAGPLRLPVQTVLRDGDVRLYAGRVESGVDPARRQNCGWAAAAARDGGAGAGERARRGQRRRRAPRWPLNWLKSATWRAAM